MLIVGLGKYMSAGAVGDEKHFLRAGRICNGLDRSASRIGDWTRRKPIDHVGVVRSRCFLFRLGDRMSERSLTSDEAVDDRRIGFEPPPLLQPVDENGGDARTLLRLACLLFDNRCEN